MGDRALAHILAAHELVQADLAVVEGRCARVGNDQRVANGEARSRLRK